MNVKPGIITKAQAAQAVAGGVMAMGWFAGMVCVTLGHFWYFLLCVTAASSLYNRILFGTWAPGERYDD